MLQLFKLMERCVDMEHRSPRHIASMWSTFVIDQPRHHSVAVFVLMNVQQPTFNHRADPLPIAVHVPKAAGPAPSSRPTCSTASAATYRRSVASRLLLVVNVQRRKAGPVHLGRTLRGHDETEEDPAIQIQRALHGGTLRPMGARIHQTNRLFFLTRDLKVKVPTSVRCSLQNRMVSQRGCPTHWSQCPSPRDLELQP